MQLNVKTSKENQVIVKNLTRKFDFQNEAIIARIAIAYSLQKRDKIDTSTQNLDNSGKEYHGHNLFNENTENLYRVMFSQYYEKVITDEEWTKLVKFHLDKGLSDLNDLIYNQYKNHVDILIDSIKSGLQLLDMEEYTYSTEESKNIGACNKEILLQFGISKNEDPVSTIINDEKENSNQHIAIAGTTGAGKTEFVKDLLWQIHNQSDGELKFIFFDPKGEGKEGKLKPFLEKTQCNFVDVGKGGLDFDPLSHINLINKHSQRIEIQSFRDSIASINNTGPTQRKNLSTTIHKIFDEVRKDGEHPTIEILSKELNTFYEEQDMKPDNLVAIFDDIAGWFSKKSDKNIYDSNQYINLPANMPSSASQTIIFLILNYLNNIFMSCGDTNSNNSIKSMRYVIVVDEAHVYLKNKKAAEILERLLRLVRSKGVMVVLMTQGVEDYKNKDFDFSSQIGTSVLLNIKDKSNKHIQSFLGIDKNDSKLSKCLEGLNPKKGVVYKNELRLIDINLFFSRK